jgi:heat shock protein HslJ
VARRRHRTPPLDIDAPHAQPAAIMDWFMPRLVAGTLLIACAGGAGAAAPPTPTDLVGTEWLLEDLGGRGVLDNAQTTLSFPEAGRIAGSGGCNRYTASAALDGERLSVDGLAATRRACVPAVMDQESRYLGALERATRIERADPFLLVHVAGMEKPLKFTRMRPGQGAASGSGPPARVTGTVTWRQALPIPPDAVLTVRLVDTSRADAPAEVLSERTFSALSSTPIRFELPYDPARIDPRFRYQVNARIEARGALRFISTTAHPVLTRGAPSHVDIVVEPVL